MLNSGVQNNSSNGTTGPRSYLFPNDDGTCGDLLSALAQRRLFVLDLNRPRSYGKLLDNTICGSSYGLSELCQQGDTVAILYGCSWPVILRAHEEVPTQFRVLGEAYVDGLMEGQALEVRIFKEQIFNL